jgi:cytoskeleton protein RodZ
MSEPTEDSVEESTPSPSGSLGAMLRDAREARGLTQREAADSLNLSAHFLEALEAERFEKLPAPTFVRGYLRSYARMLGLTEEDVISRYYAIAGEDRSDPYFAARRDTHERPVEIVHEYTGQVLAAVFALVVLVILIALWAVWPEEEPEVKGVVEAPEIEVAREVEPLRRELPIEGIQARETVAASPELGYPVSEPFVPEAEPQVTITRRGADIAVDAGGEDTLLFMFSEDCWTEVRDGEDRQIYGDLNRGGQTLELKGKAPFAILVGYSPGVTLRFNGQAVALGPHTRANVATLVLGQ